MNLRIKKLDIFITKQFAMLFVGTFFISQFVLMMQFLWRYIDTLIGKGLSMDVLAQFFWYMALMLVPQALPLAILLSSLITFGNLGESSELTAIKAAGISLMQAFRPLIIISVLICGVSFVFQNEIAPQANLQLAQLMASMKQKSPELEIPEGVFYDGIPDCNLYVQKKNMETGKLYGIMIYRMTNSYEDAAIILADSGMLQSTAEKKHLLLTLESGEWFENMRSGEFGNAANVPYRRETFARKNLLLDFDGEFNMADGSGFSNDARGKSLEQIHHDMDSLIHNYDSIGRGYYKDIRGVYLTAASMPVKDSVRVLKDLKTNTTNLDTLFQRLAADKQLNVVNQAMNKINSVKNDLEFRQMPTLEGDKLIRQHKIEAIGKYTLALICIIFFFIGAPLGTIIRKGGLGVPVIIATLVFITYYILDNVGYRMARGGMWTIWFGKGLALAVLAPMAVFFTYKANNDSTVFNVDFYKEMLLRFLGLRTKRSIPRKEVIINDPLYEKDAETLEEITATVKSYSQAHNLLKPPSIIKVFFVYKPDHEIEEMYARLEETIEDLTNTRDREILRGLNMYPLMAVKAHTRPFEHKWMNIVAAILLPVGAFLYIRMWRFRLRLHKDLGTIVTANDRIIKRIGEIVQAQG